MFCIIKEKQDRHKSRIQFQLSFVPNYHPNWDLSILLELKVLQNILQKINDLIRFFKVCKKGFDMKDFVKTKRRRMLFLTSKNISMKQNFTYGFLIKQLSNLARF